FMNMGDIVDNGEDHTQWEAWFHGVEGIMDRIPFVPVMGNHETYDQNWNVRLPLAYLNYFIVPENHSVPFSRYYYSFDYGDVHFMVLNSQWDETSDFKQGLKEEQQAWLREDSEKTGKKWRIVLIHKDVLQYRIHQRPERKEGFSDVGDAFMPLFDELGIDIVFTAHLHTYRNRGHIYHFERNAKGPLYILTGVAGNVRYPGLWIDHALDETVAPQPETDNYLTLEASRERLVVRSFLPDGTEIDHAEITKQRI
ncbi:MAG: metallophosphoesterase, partial [Selenomonadaceae bacterium]|nr:metallophosphoesterase [Selenomonadaceae bacterium]